MPFNKPRSPAHASALEQNLAVAIVLWVMLAGICVVIVNAWAMEMIV